MRRLIFAALAFLVLAVAPARAQLTIEIVGGAGTTVPIAIVPFENESNWPLGISGIVAGELLRSGEIRQVSGGGSVPRPGWAAAALRTGSRSTSRRASACRRLRRARWRWRRARMTR